MKNAEYNMIIRNTDNELKDAFIAKAKKLGLTVSNNRETKNGIENIEEGHCISVGTSDKFHVNWAKRIDYYADRSITPVYDISLDWSKIISRLEKYAEAVSAKDNEDFTLEDGTEVSVDNDEQEVTLNDHLVLNSDDLAVLRKLAAFDLDVIVDAANGTITLNGDYSITFDEIEELEEKLA